MSTTLTLFNLPAVKPFQVVAAPEVITRVLSYFGIEYTKWGEAEAEVMLAAAATAHGYTTRDVVRMTPDHPDAAAARQKFLSEHTHADDEARYFAAGSGTFYLHLPDTFHKDRRIVAALSCTQGDWIRIPAGTPHWFDMGAAPSFAAVRLFTRPDGWVADFTGSDLATRLPSHDTLRDAS